MTSAIAHQNHYVPIWYQKRFIIALRPSLYYLDLAPDSIVLPDGRTVAPRNPSSRAPKSCFWERDLYTTRFGNVLNDEVEKFFFGAIDSDGAKAVRAFVDNDRHTMHDLFQRFFDYLNAQKLRTPKGLDWIRSRYPHLTQVDLMLEMQYLRGMHCTMWYECVREIVSADQSDVKFIVTDHPVTTYHPSFPPISSASVYPEDPSIALNATQTLFPLGANHCLILTNLDYAKDPDEVDPMAPRQNARYIGQAIARTDALIRTRTLSRDEVVSINRVLKARARRFIAAADPHWLKPDDVRGPSWADIASTLRPPPNELYHFGGEIYIGYEDGTTHYQDAYGRTSSIHTHLQKKPRAAPPGANELCGCGSGRTFSRCCDGVAAEARPTWDVYSIRERNIMFANAVMHILGLDKDKSWPDVQRELSDEQVKRIHLVLEGLWPKDTNIAELLPRPDPRILRAVYMGPVDPRTIAASVASWLTYFDEIVMIHPFQNPGYMKAEYSPVDSPSQYKQQTLKNVMLLITMMPAIDAGLVHLVPDPAEFNSAFRTTIWTMAKERTASWQPTEQDMQRFRALARDDFKRTTMRLPDDSWRAMLRKSIPGITPEKIEQTIRYMREEAAKDPLALLQPMSGHVQLFKAMNLELAMFIAQLTGSTIYTDEPVFWTHLQEHTSANGGADQPSGWAPVIEKLRTFKFTIEVNPLVNLEMRGTATLSSMREVFRQVWHAVRARAHGKDGEVGTIAERLVGELDRADETMRAEWGALVPMGQSARLQRGLELSVPTNGFWHKSVYRLLITFGREKYTDATPMAMLVTSADAQSDAEPEQCEPGLEG